MAGNMDERVVSMEFDNKNFEKNVRHSMKTIYDLKSSLDFEGSGKSLDELDKKFQNFGKKNAFKDVNESCFSLRKGMGLLGSSAGNVFSQFAQITKITAMIELAEKAVRRLESAIKQFTIAPVGEGFEKYTTKIGAIKTISNATKLGAETVNDELERLNWFTDETSASFSNMVENIGKFTSVGKGLDESITAMQGIATWGYQSGAGVQEINRAMYNLSQALGTGTVKLIDWKSIENAGMATKEFKEQAIAAAEAAGTLKRKGDKLYTKKGNKQVTFENFNETLAQGWFTSDALMSVLENYGGFAKELKDYMEKNPSLETAKDAMYEIDSDRLDKRVKIFQEHLDELGDKANMSAEQVQEEIDRISEIEKLKEREAEIAKFAEKFGVNMEEIKKASEIIDTKAREKEFKRLSQTTGVSVDILQELAETEETLGEKAFKSSQQSKSFRDSIEATKDAVSTGWMNTFQKIFGGLDESVELWSDVTDIMWELFASGADNRNNALTHWAEEFAGRDDLWGEDGIMHSIMDTVIELKKLFGTSFKNVFFKDLEKVLGGNPAIKEGEEDLNGMLTEDQLRYRREGNYFGSKIKEITTALKNFGLTIKNFVNNNMEKFGSIFESVAAVVHFFGHIIGGIFNTIGDFLTNSGIVQDVLDLAARVGTKIKEIVEKIEESGFITKVLKNIGDTLTWLYTTIKKWIDQISEFFEETGIGEAIRNFFKSIGEFFLGGEKDVDENGQKTESAFFRAFSWLGAVKDWIDKINFKDILYSIKTVIDNFGTIWRTFIQGLNGTTVTKDQFKQGGVSDKLADILETVSNFGNKLAGVYNFIKGIVDSVIEWLETSGILPTIRSWWDSIKTFFENIGLLWNVFVKGKEVDPKDLNDKQKNLINGIKNFFKKLQNLWNKIKNWFVKAWNWITEKWNQLVGWLESSGILPKIRSLWDKIKTIVSNIGVVWRTFVRALNGTTVTKDQLKQGGVSDKLADVLVAVSNFGAKIKEIWGKVVDWLETSGILPTIREWWEKIKAFFEEVWKSIGDGTIFQKVGDFFANIWNNITGWFGGGSESVDVDVSTPDVNLNVQKGKINEKGAGEAQDGGTGIGGFFNRFISGFTNDKGEFDLIQGISTGISGLFELIGSIDWTNIAGNVFGIMVDVINGLDDACGELHIDNILAIIKKVLDVFSGVMIVKMISDIFSTIKSIVKKGKDRSILQQFTDLIVAIGTALLQLGIAIALIAVSMWLISKIDDKGFAKALAILITIGAFFIFIMFYAAVLGKKKNNVKSLAAMGATFLQIGIAVALIAFSIVMLTVLMSIASPGAIIASVLLVSAIMVGMVLLIKWMSKITQGNTVRISAGIAVFAGMAILLATFTICILLLQRVDYGKALANALLLGGILAAVVAGIKFLDKVKISAKVIAVMVVMALIIGIATAAFILLKDIPGEQAILQATAMSIVLGTIVAAIKLLEHVSPKGAMMAALAIGLFILALSAALSVGILMISGSVKVFIDQFVGMMSSMGAASNSAKTIDKEAILDAVGLLVEIVEAFAKVTSCDTSVALSVASDTWTFLVRFKLASESAKMIDIKQIEAIFGKDGTGGLLSTICTAFSNVKETGSTAVTLSSNLRTFGENLQLFGSSASGFVDDSTNYKAGIESIFGKNGLFELIKTSVSGITDTGGNARILLENLADMGNHLELLSISGAKLGGDTQQNITNVRDRLSDLNDIANLAKSLITVSEGENGQKIDLTDFSLGITNIGSALQIYNSAVSTLEEEVNKNTDGKDVVGEIKPVSTEKIKEALTLIVQGLPSVSLDSSQISNIETWASLGGDGANGSMFALGLVSMANALSEFSKSAKDFDSENSQNAIDALSQLSAIYIATGNGNPSQFNSTISGVSRWKQQMGAGSGDNNAFASSIIGMGNALSSFSTSAENYDATKGSLAVSALSMLAEIYNTTGMNDPSRYNSMIHGVKGWDIEEGESGKGTFINAIVGMGNAMKSFGESVKDIPNDSVTNAVTALETFTSIYNEVSGNRAFIAAIKDNNENEILAIVAAEILEKDIVKTFTDLGEGIGKLGDALLSFSNQVNAEVTGYNQIAVEDAVKIIEKFTELEIALRESGLQSDLLFHDDENLGTLSSNLAGLGSRLAQFSAEINGAEDGSDKFELTTNTQKWEDIKNVLLFFVGISSDLAKITDRVVDSNDYTHNGLVISYTLGNLADDMAKVITAFETFNEAMVKVYKIDNAANPSKDITYHLGEWADGRWENIKDVLNLFRDISIRFKNNGLKEGQFYDLDQFGHDIERFIDQVNWEDKFAKFTQKLNGSEDGINTESFAHFINSIKTMADTAGILKNSSVNSEDITTMAELVQSIVNIDTTAFNGETFNIDGIAMAAAFITGFVDKLSNTEDASGVVSIGSAFSTLLSILESYSDDFFEQGRTAGERYGKGFAEGFNSSRLTPITDLDATGVNISGSTTVSGLLMSLNLAKSTDIMDLSARLDSINSHFIDPIRVHDDHSDIIRSIADTNDRLKGINDNVNRLHDDVYNLKIYMDTNRLVGAIAPEMNRKLGSMANVSWP